MTLISKTIDDNDLKYNKKHIIIKNVIVIMKLSNLLEQ